MNLFEVIISSFVAIIALLTLIDKIGNRKKTDREAMCKEHSNKINNLQIAIKEIKTSKADNSEINEIFNELASLKADMETVKKSINRIETILIERTL